MDNYNYPCKTGSYPINPKVSTRMAVETAIDQSKRDKTSTWNSLTKGNQI
jgi:hypothetical protein